MGRGFAMWVLLGILAGLAFEAGVGERGGRERMTRPQRDGGVRIMDGGDGMPPPPSTI